MYPLPPEVPTLFDSDRALDQWSRLEGKSVTMADELGRRRQAAQAQSAAATRRRRRLQFGALAAAAAVVLLIGCVL